MPPIPSTSPTPRQIDALRIIATAKVSPTFRELGAALKVRSTNRVAELVGALTRLNLLQPRLPGAARQLFANHLGIRVLLDAAEAGALVNHNAAILRHMRAERMAARARRLAPLPSPDLDNSGRLRHTLPAGSAVSPESEAASSFVNPTLQVAA